MSLHVVELPFSLRLSNILLCVYVMYVMCIYYILLIHSPTNGYLSCFHIRAVVKSAVMNITVIVPLQDPDFSSFGQINFFWKYLRFVSASNCGSILL